MPESDVVAGTRLQDDILPVLICQIDAADVIVQVGAAAAPWFDRPPALLAGTPAATLLGAAGWSTIHAHLVGARAGQPVTFDTTVVAGERPRSVRISLEAPGPGPGGVPCVLMAVEDLTGLRDAERRARTAAAQFVQAFEASAAGLGIVAADGRWLRVNRALCEILGYTEDELLGLRFQDITHPLDLDADLVQNTRLFAGEIDRFAMQKRYLRKDGRAIDVHLAVALVRDEQGRPRHTVAQIIDLSARVEAETQLREHELLYRAITESSPVGIFVDVPGVRCVYVNPAYERISGVPRAEALGVGWKRGVHPDDLERVEAAISRRVVQGGVGGMEHRFLHADGRVVQVRVTTVEMRDGERSHGFLGVVEDITEARAAAAEIHALNAELGQRVAERTRELEAAMRDLESFAYSVSHDLKAPLRAIDGYSALLLEKPVPDAEAGELLHTVRATIARMAQLIDDLLALSQVGRRELSVDDVDLAVLGRSIAAELAAGRSGEPVRVRIAETLPARGDAHLLRVLLQNLLDNAWKFSARVAGAEVELGARREAGGLVYYVRDNGAGFDPAYAGKLFQPFQRLHRADDFAGSGVGLASAHRIVERHGGRIWAQSTPGAGATFAFTLAARPAA